MLCPCHHGNQMMFSFGMYLEPSILVLSFLTFRNADTQKSAELSAHNIVQHSGIEDTQVTCLYQEALKTLELRPCCLQGRLAKIGCVEPPAV